MYFPNKSARLYNTFYSTKFKEQVFKLHAHHLYSYSFCSLRLNSLCNKIAVCNIWILQLKSDVFAELVIVLPNIEAYVGYHHHICTNRGKYRLFLHELLLSVSIKYFCKGSRNRETRIKSYPPIKNNLKEEEEKEGETFIHTSIQKLH